ncbi:MAG: hypothetical protein K2Q03_04695 [Sphingobacteriaceae bacterium]|nr:hypothetical protein [Sphingobacteriaceae bacterium]
MLTRGIKLFTVLLLMTNWYACSDKKKDLLEKRKLYTKVATQIAGKEMYDSIYKVANDTIKKSIKNRLSDYKYYISHDWYLDSLICFNKKMNRCVMALSSKSSIFTTDGMVEFYGAKINNKWYFFKGGNFVLPREYYQEDVSLPLSTEILHEIAIENIFGGYLKQNKKGVWEVNEKWFQYYFGGASWDCGYLGKQGWVDTCSNKTFENLILKEINKSWKNRDTTKVLTPNLR